MYVDTYTPVSTQNSRGNNEGKLFVKFKLHFQKSFYRQANQVSLRCSNGYWFSNGGNWKEGVSCSYLVFSIDTFTYVYLSVPLFKCENLYINIYFIFASYKNESTLERLPGICCGEMMGIRIRTEVGRVQDRGRTKGTVFWGCVRCVSSSDRLEAEPVVLINQRAMDVGRMVKNEILHRGVTASGTWRAGI